MVHLARNLAAAAVLLLGITLAAPLHASSAADVRQAARAEATAPSWSADLWSSDWLVKLFQGVWTKAGSLLHPGGGSIAAPPARPAAGITIDPSGGR
jgi:hypothetical protein